MGSRLHYCCSQDNKENKDNERVDYDSRGKSHHNGMISPFLADVISQQHIFEEQLQTLNKQKIKKMQGFTYYGEVDDVIHDFIKKNEPKGFGIKIISEQEQFIGNFKDGKLNGTCLCSMTDNGYYKGKMMDDIAEDMNGYYKDSELQYQGGFKNNIFQGEGKLKNSNFMFQGLFQLGKIKKGVLAWKEEDDKKFQYEGSFNQSQQFEGQGILKQPLGTYEGSFKDGKKYGKGIYRFSSNLRYQGQYKNNQKHGKGKIINSNNTIAFHGQFQHDLPHGKGLATDQKGQIHYLQFNKGVYAHLV